MAEVLTELEYKHFLSTDDENLVTVHEMKFLL